MLVPHTLNPFPKTIYKTTSPFSGEIRVVQRGRERQLIIGGFVQSVNWDCPGVDKRVWGQIAKRIQDSVPKNKESSILILGFGTGTEVHLVSNKYPNAQFTAVEMDSKIIKVAKDYFEIDKIPNLEIVEGDAFEYVRKLKKKFNTVVCDFYAGGSYPPEADSDAFLTKLSRSADTVIFNRIFDTIKAPDAKEFFGRLSRYFKKVEIVPVKHNALNILYICAMLEDEK